MKKVYLCEQQLTLDLQFLDASCVMVMNFSLEVTELFCAYLTVYIFNPCN
jgi:hypothetical protein